MQTTTTISAIFLALAMAFSSNAVAQNATAATGPKASATAAADAPEGIVMSSGALVEIKNGRGTRIDTERKFDSGLRLTPGGTLTFADGTSANLRDGQMLTSDNKIISAPPAAMALANDALVGTSGVGTQRN